MSSTLRICWAAAGLLACAAAVGGCGSSPGSGSGSGGEDEPPARTTASTPAAGSDPGEFPKRPQVLLRFDKPAEGWPRGVRRGEARGGYGRDGYVLDVPAGAPALRVAARAEVRPATRGVLLETTVRLPPDGGAGLFCRGSGETASGYALTVERRGRWTIERFEDGRARLLGSGPLARQAAGGTLIRFICGAAAEGEPLTLGAQIGATPLEFVKDPEALAPASSSSTGILLLPGPGAATSASFDYFAASVAT